MPHEGGVPVAVGRLAAGAASTRTRGCSSVQSDSIRGGMRGLTMTPGRRRAALAEPPPIEGPDQLVVVEPGRAQGGGSIRRGDEDLGVGMGKAVSPPTTSTHVLETMWRGLGTRSGTPVANSDQCRSSCNPKVTHVQHAVVGEERGQKPGPVAEVDQMIEPAMACCTSTTSSATVTGSAWRWPPVGPARPRGSA